MSLTTFTQFVPSGRAARWLAVLAAPATVVFISSNLVNVGNLAFNMIFSRLMGPDMFGVLALVLTIKLALLGVLGAVQMATSQVVAADQGRKGSATERSLSRINRFLLVGLGVILIPMAAGLWAGETVGARHGLPAPHLLMILLAAVPFGASLSVLRGLTFGRMQTGRIVASANIEMVVRLVGALAAWFLGFGLEGVLVAIALSIVAGWAVLADLLPYRAGPAAPIAPMARNLTFAALPFGLLQLAQVLAMDGDIFLAKAALPAVEAGYIGALSLFQRIQFFAFFALASVLLPGVVRAAKSGEDVVAAAKPVAFLFGGLSLPLGVLAITAPELLIRLLVGEAFLPAAPSLALVVLSAIAFTFSYLVATFLAALGDRTGIVLVFAVAVIQLATMAGTDTSHFVDLVRIETDCQIVASILVFAVATYRVCKHRAARAAS